MGKLIGQVAAVLAYLCVATVVAAASGGAYLHLTGKLDRGKIQKLAAVLQGAELAVDAKNGHKPEDADREDRSFEELDQARELRARYLEMREQSLKSGLDRVRFEKDKLSEEKDRYVRLKNSFEEELDKMHQGAVTSGKENVRLIWETIKPKQAKEQIMQMIDAGEMSEVIPILSAMPIARRAKIIAEFKTQPETEKLGEILRLIRQGVPEVDLIEDTKNQVKQP